MPFKEIPIEQWKDNVFDRIGKQWMLITAGNEKKCNTMTASWGGVGVLWNKNVTFAFIRPSRYTMEFVESQEGYSLCFFDESYRDALSLCGTKSGRDLDKIDAIGFHTEFDQNIPYFAEASLVLICKKLYVQDMNPQGFINKNLISSCYPDEDYHRVYVGEIEKILSK